MSQPFCLLGLGPEIEASLEPLLAALPTGPVAPDREVIRSDSPEQWFAAVVEYRPQIILLRDRGGAERGKLIESFLVMLAGLNERSRPRVFLMLDDLPGYLSYRIEQAQDFAFKGLPCFKLDQQEQLCLADEGPEDYQPIDPAPTWSLTAQGALRAMGNLPLEAFEGFNWKGRTFEPGEFFELMAYLKEGEFPVPASQSFFVFGGDLYLKRRFHLRELDYFETGGCRIEHLMAAQNPDSENAEVFGLKLYDLIRELGHFHWAQQRWSDHAWLKARIPLAVRCDHQALALFAQYHLNQAGFLTQPQVGTLELDLSQGAADFNWPPELWALPFFEDLKDQALELDLPPATEMTLADIARSREGLFRRKERLTERQKAYEGAKLLKAQEEDIKVMARRKLELLGQLMNRAEIYEPNSDEMILKLGQDCLVFYEDEALARQISRHLQGSGKNLFFDIGGFTNLKSLLTYKTDHLVPFLKHGHVLVTDKSRDYLLKKLDRIAEETKRQVGMQSDLTGQELGSEREQLQWSFETLACLEAWVRSLPLFKDWLPKVEERLDETAKARVRKNFEPKEREVVLLARDARSFQRISGLLKPMEISGFVARPELLERLEGHMDDEVATEALAKENGLRVARFLNQVLEELKPLEGDLLVIDQEVNVAVSLLRLLRQSEVLAEWPVVLLLDREIDRQRLDELLDLKTLPLYLGRHFSALGSNWSRFF
ncbi:MAG: hypothetical protein RRB13_07405 [bacterium]|nr:hypothetical protein [bacterium]